MRLRALLWLLWCLLVGSLAGVVLGVGLALPRSHPAPAPVLLPAAGARPEIQVLPCPTGVLSGPGPGGAYVCRYDLPPDPGTGPVLAR